MLRVRVEFHVTATVALSKRLLEEVAKPDWQKDLYHLPTAKDVANHVAYNMLRGWNLAQLDGFAHLDDSDAVLSEVEWDSD